jgi:RNA polymerase sigma factor (sigma-70 family)
VARNLERKSDVAGANRENLEELIVRYRPRLESFIRGRVGNREDAEDILQDVFYQLVKTVNTTMNPVEQVAAWLYRVARNTIINHGREKREERMPVRRDDDDDDEMAAHAAGVLLDDASPASPEMEYLRSLVWQELENALAELPPGQREIYELTEFDGVPVKDISRATGIPVNTLLSRKHYAVLHLRERMRQLHEEIVCR